jgi:hypothetical protein
MGRIGIRLTSIIPVAETNAWPWIDSMKKRTSFLSHGLPALALAALMAASGCTLFQGSGNERQRRIGPGRVTPAEVQSEIITFTDNYIATIGPGTERAIMGTDDLAQRARLHSAKLVAVQNALIIASSANPIVALLDMTVLVSLQRRSLQTPESRELLGAESEAMLAGMDRLYADIWRLANAALDERQRAELHAVIDDLGASTTGNSLIGVRASEFARMRQQSISSGDAPGSLLQLFYLDPLAGLSPASRELLESRLLAERVFFFATRLPNVLNWQTKDLFYQFATSPLTTQTLGYAATASDAAARATVVAEDLPRLIAEQRQATVEQVFERLEQEREAVFDRLDQENAELNTTLSQLRETIRSGEELLRVAEPTANAANELMRSIERLREPRERTDPAGRPFDITEYAATAEALGEAIERATEALRTFEDVLGSPEWNERNGQIDATLDAMTTRSEAVLNKAFARGVALVAITAVAALLVGLGLMAARGRFPGAASHRYKVDSSA